MSNRALTGVVGSAGLLGAVAHSMYKASLHAVWDKVFSAANFNWFETYAYKNDELCVWRRYLFIIFVR